MTKQQTELYKKNMQTLIDIQNKLKDEDGYLGYSDGVIKGIEIALASFNLITNESIDD